MLNQCCTDLPTFIVSDDFTGANDMGAGLASLGVPVSVILDASSRTVVAPDTTAILCSDSRDDTPAVAGDKLQQLIRCYPEVVRQKVCLKKVDSTLRGNLGAEIAQFVGTYFPLAIVAIGAPQAGRRTTNGHCYVHDRLLTTTEYASDPKSPVQSSRIQTLLESQCDLVTRELFLDHVRAPALSQTMTTLHQAGAQIVVCDVERAGDLQAIYQAAMQLNHPVLVVTTGEMVSAICMTDDLTANVHPLTPPIRQHQGASPLLGVIGSMSQVTLEQVERVVAHERVTVLDIDLPQLLGAESDTYLRMLSRSVSDCLSQHRHCLLRSCQDKTQRHDIEALCQTLHLSRHQLGNRIKHGLAQVARLVMQPDGAVVKPGALFLCGGDIALAVCRALGATQFELQGRVARCLSCGTLSFAASAARPEPAIPVFTKAGGFGTPDSLLQLITFLQPNQSLESI
ncbi:four-carbon acid sugar kinase family protein [Vibrio rhizosphaerae]|uniref:four-carbon acid sugar kinase family protein n=1 Tax=Vibrio rhizosphaerae TaxID=398736 RepID=UPI00056E2A68|nr:four-carbon acid sugar kinase family protein [Vibrio rhizosphaerae]